MPIGVYRIFLSASWSQGSEIEDLVSGFDQLPSFLYRIDRVAAAGQPAHAVGEAPMRIAMTQSHVALLLADRVSDRLAEVATEVRLARSGFRRRIPVIAVARRRGGTTPDDAALAVAVDRIVDFDAAAVACAVQDLVEEARSALRQSDGSIRLVPPAARPAEGKADGRPDVARPLPFDAVISALDDLRRRRRG